MIPQKERRNEEGGFVELCFEDQSAGQIHIPRTQHALARLVADNAFVRFEESETGRSLMEDDDELSLCQEGPSPSFVMVQEGCDENDDGQDAIVIDDDGSGESPDNVNGQDESELTDEDDN